MTGTESRALLLMDFQVGLASRLAEESRERVISATAHAAEIARERNVPVIHLRTCFRPGHPEASSRNKRMSQVAAARGLVEGTEGAAFVETLSPLSGEIAVAKHRVSAFSDTALGAVLRGLGVTSLYLCGITTSGVVLSTLRSAVDLDYSVTVLQPCCADVDDVAHEALMTRVFPVHADVQPDLAEWAIA